MWGGGKTADNQLVDSIYLVREFYQHKAFKRKNGFEITGQTYYRLDNAFSFDEETDQYSSYTAKLQGELGWNFFNSSFFQRKAGLQLITVENRLDCLQQQKQLLETSCDDAFELLDQRYRNRLRSVLAEQLRNLSILDMAYQFALEKDRAGSEKLMEVMSEQMRVEYTLAQAGGTPEDSTLYLQTINPIILEIDTTALFDRLLVEDIDLQIADLRMERLVTQQRLTNYAREMRLTPFVRASRYFRSYMPSSTNVEAGIRFTIPLYADASAKRKALRAEETLLGLESERRQANINFECRKLINQLDRLNKAVAVEHRHALQLRRFIALRRKAYQESVNGYNHIARLEEYNQYLKSLERMYGLLHQRNMYMIQMQELASISDIRPMVFERRIEQ